MLIPNSNRMGLHLQGSELKHKKQRDNDPPPHGVVPDVIQVPPSGQPIVSMADTQTTDGYPKISSVILADQQHPAQISLGTRMRFERVTLEEVEATHADMVRYLQQIEITLGWKRRGILSSARRIAKTRLSA